MRATLLLLALAGLALVAPSAAAQKNGQITLEIQPLGHPLVPGEHASLPGRARLVADATTYAELGGVPFKIGVDRAPTWLTITVSPSSATFPSPPPGAVHGTAYVSEVSFVVDLIAASDVGAQGYVVDVFGLVAASHTSFGGVVGHAAVPVSLDTPPPPCREGSPYVAQAAGATTLPAPVAPWLALGAAVGLGAFALAFAARRGVGALAILGVLLVVAAPAAQAQRNGSLVFSPVRFDETLHAGSFAVADARVTLTADPTAHLETGGVPVSFQVTRAPAWATVVLTPPQAVFSPPPPGAWNGGAYVSDVQIGVVVAVGDLNFSGDVVDLVEITGVTMGPMGSVVARTSFPLVLHAEERCVPAAEPTPLAKLGSASVSAQTASATPPTTGEEDGSRLTVQTNSAAFPVAGSAVVAGFGLAGAGLGFVLSRRRP